MWDLIDSADADTAAIPEQFTPSLNDLARTTGLSNSTVKRELNRLEKDGWVIRDRPDPMKARTEFARTGYRLTVPPRPTVGLAPEPRPTVDPDLGPERTVPRPTVGHIPTPHRLDLDQSSDDDRNQDDEEQRRLLAAIETRLLLRTGRPCPPGWAPNVTRCIFETSDGRPRDGIKDPIAYAERAIDSEPDPIGRFYPSPHETPVVPVEPLPGWCGTCGLDDGQHPDVMRRNGRLRFTGGKKCEECHPDMVRH